MKRDENTGALQATDLAALQEYRNKKKIMTKIQDIHEIDIRLTKIENFMEDFKTLEQKINRVLNILEIGR